jgi:molybdopterin converting factor small subunit
MEAEENLRIRVVIPHHLHQFTNGSDIVELAASDMAECLYNLESQFPGLKGQFIDSEGRLRPFFNIYINGEDIRWAQGLATHVEDGDEIWIVTLFPGG